MQSSIVLIHLSSTGGSRTTHGFRNVRSPSRRPCGATRSRCPEDAAHAKIAEGDKAAIVADGRFVSGRVVSNGLAPGVLRLSLGYGRKRAGAIGDGVGFNVSILRTSASPWITRGAMLHRTGPDGKLSPSTAGLFALPGKAQKLAPLLRPGETIPGPALSRASHAAAPARRRPLCMGDGDRYRRLHRLQCVRRRLPIRKQRPLDRAG